MNFEHLKTTVPALIGSVGSAELASLDPNDYSSLANTIVQVLIGILTIFGFFRNRKKQ